jgi:hypothetical protein
MKISKIKSLCSSTTRSIKIRSTLSNSSRPWKKTLWRRKIKTKKRKKLIKMSKRIERRLRVS